MKAARKLVSLHARFVAALDKLLLPSLQPRRDLSRKDQVRKYFSGPIRQDDGDIRRKRYRDGD